MIVEWSCLDCFIFRRARSAVLGSAPGWKLHIKGIRLDRLVSTCKSAGFQPALAKLVRSVRRSPVLGCAGASSLVSGVFCAVGGVMQQVRRRSRRDVVFGGLGHRRVAVGLRMTPVMLSTRGGSRGRLRRRWWWTRNRVRRHVVRSPRGSARGKN